MQGRNPPCSCSVAMQHQPYTAELAGLSGARASGRPSGRQAGLAEERKRTMRLPRPPPVVTAYSEAKTWALRSADMPSKAFDRLNIVGGSAGAVKCATGKTLTRRPADQEARKKCMRLKRHLMMGSAPCPTRVVMPVVQIRGRRISHGAVCDQAQAGVYSPQRFKERYVVLRVVRFSTVLRRSSNRQVGHSSVRGWCLQLAWWMPITPASPACSAAE